MIRLRNKGTIREINVTDKKVKTIQHKVSSTFRRHAKMKSVKEIVKAAACYVSGGIPAIKNTVFSSWTTKTESYSKSSKTVFKRNRS